MNLLCTADGSNGLDAFVRTLDMAMLSMHRPVHCSRMLKICMYQVVVGNSMTAVAAASPNIYR